MSDSSFVVNFLAAVLAALVLGYVAHRLHLPTIIGYLLAGVAVGPHTPGFMGDPGLVRSLAEVGVAFLMFAVGTRVHLNRLRRVYKVGVLGGLAQVALTIALGAIIGKSLGAGWPAAFFFGALISVSSTAVAVKLLYDRGHLDSLHGKVALAILLVQDLLVLPLILVLPVLAHPGETSAFDSLIALAKAAGLLLASLIVGARVIPWLLERVARTASQELFIFASISIALGSAIGTQALGVSAAVGAFLAGVAISQGKFSEQVSSAFSPFQDLFGIFFFISVGMLLDPALLRHELAAAAVTILLVIGGKLLLVTLLTRLFGYSRPVSLLVGLSLAQVGELSFILAGLGLNQGLIEVRLYNLVVMSALASIFVSPFLVQFGEAALKRARLRRVPRQAPVTPETGPGSPQ
ncbi:MAG: cation:proton antiporter [Chloroflexi bacterium]|nr:cation:proton antiporter [Chloroflexota bacterium]